MTKKTFKNYIRLFLLSVVILSMLGCCMIQPCCSTKQTIGPRPSTWAVQMKGTCNVPNLYMIDKNVYRSGRLTEAGLRLLCEKKYIKTIINLEEFNSDTDIKCPNKLYMVQVPFNPIPSFENKEMIDGKVIEVMKIIAHKENRPVLIHCLHGSDRTGLMSAMYRLLFCKGWTKEKAIDEMENGGYGFNASRYGYFRDYIKSTDIEKLRKAIQAK
jgi:protein tyrosine/serine phosphatase